MQQQAIAEIEKLGGKVRLNSEAKVVAIKLNSPQMTDDGLEHLKGLTNLKLLFLEETKVTDAGVAELQKSLPDCKIQR